MSTEGVYSRDMGRGNSREGGGCHVACRVQHELNVKAEIPQVPRDRVRVVGARRVAHAARPARVADHERSAPRAVSRGFVRRVAVHAHLARLLFPLLALPLDPPGKGRPVSAVASLVTSPAVQEPGSPRVREALLACAPRSPCEGGAALVLRDVSD